MDRKPNRLLAAFIATLLLLGLLQWVGHHREESQRCGVGVSIDRLDETPSRALELPDEYFARFPEPMKKAFRNATLTGQGATAITEAEYMELREVERTFDPHSIRTYIHEGTSYEFGFVMC